MIDKTSILYLGNLISSFEQIINRPKRFIKVFEMAGPFPSTYTHAIHFHSWLNQLQHGDIFLMLLRERFEIYKWWTGQAHHQSFYKNKILHISLLNKISSCLSLLNIYTFDTKQEKYLWNNKLNFHVLIKCGPCGHIQS